MLSVVRARRDGQPELMRLSEGLALRNGERIRYVCPARFESDSTPRAAQPADGPAIVASSGGAYLLFADGAVAAHPDPALREGSIVALEASPDGGVYALRAVEGRTELLAVDAGRARVLAELPATFTALAVGDEALLAVGLSSASRVVQRGFERDGAARDEWNGEANAPLDSAAAFARLAGERAYLVVAARDGLSTELARIERDGSYRVLQRAGSPISGPVSAGARTWFAFDGRLAELRADDEVARADDATVVTCVGRSGPLAYACANNELRVLRDGALGERLFGLDEIAPPDVAGLDAELAEQCTVQWLRFRVDLVAAGVTPNDAEPEPPGPGDGGRDGGQAVGRRDAGADAGRVGDAELGQDDGCACASVGAGGAGSGSRRGVRWLLVLLVALSGFRMRQRRAARSGA